MSSPAVVSRAGGGRALLLRARAVFALLPARLDDRRFFVRFALALVLRWAALQAAWWPLREAMARVVSFTLGLFGVPVAWAGGASVAIAGETVGFTVRCTHVELYALLVPLTWRRDLGLGANLGRVVMLAVALFAMGVVRVDLSLAVFAAGVPWPWAHDVLLGVCYFAALAFALRRGAWMRGPVRRSAAASS